MKQVLIYQGKAIVEEVPVPMVEHGTVLVNVDHSCISVGTEITGIKASGQTIWSRALKHPEKVKRVFQMASKDGFGAAHDRIRGTLCAELPSGYSLAGVVQEVGEGITDLKPGDRVACAGAQCAHHAEIVRVPRNLLVPVPEGVSLAEASTVALGAIALQGVRRAQPTVGECFVVIGLGVIGQLTAQILKANGCVVIGMDLDAHRVGCAEALGIDKAIASGMEDELDQIVRLTNGVGADGVIITAASTSDAIISSGFRMCRKKGRVILVGNVGLNLHRADLYEKELDFFISTSYGPGRYDPLYEENGLEYPVAYVRWTENRNLAQYLRLIADGRVEVQPIFSASYPVEQAAKAYELLKTPGHGHLIVLLEYQRGEKAAGRKVPNPTAPKSVPGAIRIAVVGAGNFATGVHLPNLRRLSKRYSIRAICSRTGHKAASTAKLFGAQYATTDYEQVLSDSEVDAVLISTRHHLHAEMTLHALKAGKHVLVEKPLATAKADLNRIVDFFEKNSQSPVLLTGYNRRFSPHMVHLKNLVARRTSPMILNYRMNAGYLPMDHWVHTEEGGGRNIGEACHIYDLFTFLTESRVRGVQAQTVNTSASGYYSSRDNFICGIQFEDGSLATLTYTALGSKDYPKERLEVYVDGRVLVVDDYHSLSVYGAKTRGLQTRTIEKGLLQEIQVFADIVQNGGTWPNPFWQQIQAAEISFAVEKLISGQCLDSLKLLEPNRTKQ